MPGKLLIIWEFESALGKINSNSPDNFSYDPIYQEIENVDYILTCAESENIQMTFACLGFAAIQGVFPFNIPDIISKLSAKGHEIASLSWRNEWFPNLTEKQIHSSLERSKKSLETCLGIEDKVTGFVFPHNRPMSWIKKKYFNFEDRGLYPFHKGSDIGFVLKQMDSLDYKWCKVLTKYKTFREKIWGNSDEEIMSFPKWEIHENIVCVPEHYTGFDKTAIDFIKEAVNRNETAVICGHPANLSKDKNESRDHFDRFIDKAVSFREDDGLEIQTVSNFIRKYNPVTENKY
ncbi:MAG TPA: polysaccharide deacetylase family protein [Ignavibacteria bacterium]|nr:polysaccharide deacetylase family protein [Ignavibacteria bacterium]